MPLTQFSGLDECSRLAIRLLASNWRESPRRPSVSGFDALRWHAVIREWVQNRDMPLLVRRPRLGRGREIRHSSGRILVPTDNTPAMYLLSLAIEKRMPGQSAIWAALSSGRMPVATAFAGGEMAQARYTGSVATMDAPNLGDLGYSVCHITHVGLRRMPLEQRTEVELVAHSLLFLSPVNMFVVPKQYAGLGGLPEFVDEMDDARSFSGRSN